MRTLLVSCVVAGVLVLALVHAAVGVLPIAVCFGAMAACAPWRSCAGVPGAGVPACVTCGRTRSTTSPPGCARAWPCRRRSASSGRRGPEELREPFEAFADDYRLTGRFHDSLDRLKDRLSDPVGDRLVESLRIAREVGGTDLGHLLRTLSGFLREDARTRAELETRQSWTVNAARLAVAAPWAVLAMLSTNPESVAAYSTPLGVVVLAVGAAVTAVAYWAMVRIGRLPEDERVLR